MHDNNDILPGMRARTFEKSAIIDGSDTQAGRAICTAQGIIAYLD